MKSVVWVYAVGPTVAMILDRLWLRLSPMYIRLAFWTLSLAYTSAILSGSIHASSPSIMLTAALLGALLGFSLGGIFINRRTRKPQ